MFRGRDPGKSKGTGSAKSQSGVILGDKRTWDSRTGSDIGGWCLLFLSSMRRIVTNARWLVCFGIGIGHPGWEDEKETCRETCGR